MKKLIFLLLINISAFSQAIYKYDIDVTQNTDTFFVKLQIPEKLKKINRIFQFPATAPGTYQTMNIGRFVKDFKAFDKRGREISTSYIQPNQFVISKPKKLRSISYKIAETFDTPDEKMPIYLMAGTTIEKDNALINPHGVCGFFEGNQKKAFGIKVISNNTWKSVSALENQDGYFVAKTYDELVDSPILSGNLTMAETILGNTPIKVYVYSETGKIKADELLKQMTNMLNSAQKYLVNLPVDHYSFLFYFGQNLPGITGAWEHSFSSEYVMVEAEPTEKYLKQVVDIASHEFFHIVTPLNIHSEIIENFNFEKPTPSQHLWLYEGVTEWTAHMQLYRGGVTSFDEYLAKGIKQKIIVANNYFKPWSLKKIAEESFNGGEGAEQYGNIYYKGSLAASYLDIRLLELSNGKYGLREVIQRLVLKYGKGKPFSEANFFEDLTAMTFPEIKNFINNYIVGNEPLPHQEYLNKIGIDCKIEDKNVKISKIENMTEQQKMLFERWSVNLPE